MIQLPHYTVTQPGTPANLKKASNIIIDTDGGADDLHAILVAIETAKKSGQRILGITCVIGENQVESAAKNIQIALATVGSDIPVYVGCRRTISATIQYDRVSSDISQLKALDIPNLPKLALQHAVSFIIDSIHQNKNDISIIALGPMTNLACAITKDHEIENWINNVFFYGGNISGFGDEINSVCDKNVSMDVDAVHLINKVFTGRTVVVPREATIKLDKGQSKGIYLDGTTNAGNFVEKIFAHYYQEVHHYEVKSALAVIAAMRPEAIQQHAVRRSTVVLYGEAKGMMMIDWSQQRKLDNDGETAFLVSFIQEEVIGVLRQI